MCRIAEFVVEIGKVPQAPDLAGKQSQRDDAGEHQECDGSMGEPLPAKGGCLFCERDRKRTSSHH